ncbi:hypothetical protein GCM10009765_69110 [Fodinicola feengrottensis]|uniref:Periplasmic copper-binding protein NosD beta helix domain-containing protein n=1 Tax=Fodinicola feengrottensis TaxID=435914 RepID=A0ABP4URI5_9ACTN
MGLFGQWPAASFVRQAAAALPPYGTDGRGNPQSTDCQSTVTAGQSIDAAIGKAAAGAVVCVKAGDYSGQTVHLNRSKVTVRSNGVAKIKNAVVTGAGTTLDGFTVVGAAYLNPEAGIDFAGSDQKIVHNLVNGRQLAYGIRCDPCHRSTVSRNTVTNLQNYGLFVGAGAGAQITWNNVYDLHADRVNDLDVDGVRFLGAHTIRNNYIHDINQFKSKPDSTGDTPHTDCFQTYDTGRKFSGTVIEANICVRVSRQCLIAQNDTAKTYEISGIVFRDNICETYDSQGINLGSLKGVRIENNLVLSGFQYQVVSLEEQDTGLANTDTTIINNILVRAKSDAFTYERIGKTTNEKFLNNLEMLDTSIVPRDAAFQQTRGPYAAFRTSDFTSYRAYIARLAVLDRGVPGNTSPTDLAGRPRVAGPATDLGPYELGACGRQC